MNLELGKLGRGLGFSCSDRYEGSMGAARLFSPRKTPIHCPGRKLLKGAKHRGQGFSPGFCPDSSTLQG
jgi:hypothetical protein